MKIRVDNLDKMLFVKYGTWQIAWKKAGESLGDNRWKQAINKIGEKTRRLVQNEVRDHVLEKVRSSV